MLSQMIVKIGYLTVASLYLSTHRLIPHALISTTMELKRIPQEIKAMIKIYYGGFRLRFRTNRLADHRMAETRERNHHRVYHITNLVHHGNKRNHLANSRYHKRTKDGLRSTSTNVRGFMDDLTVISTHVQARWVLSELGNKGCEEAAERKTSKYANLVRECRVQGWRTWFFTVEMGYSGFPGHSVWKLMAASGFTGRRKKTVLGS